MPSAKILEQKKQSVVDLTEKLKSASAGVVVDYKGINVADDTALRKELREANVEYIVVKNTLLRFAIKNVGLDGLDDVLSGTTALAISKDDPIAPAKIVGKYVDKIEKGFEVKAGFMDNQIMDKNDVIALGKLPSKEQLLSQLLSVLTGNIRGMAIALNAIAEQKENA